MVGGHQASPARSLIAEFSRAGLKSYLRVPSWDAIVARIIVSFQQYRQYPLLAMMQAEMNVQSNAAGRMVGGGSGKACVSTVVRVFVVHGTVAVVVLAQYNSMK